MHEDLCGLVENVCENTRKVDYVIPKTNYSRDKCFFGMIFSFVSYVIQQRGIQNAVSNITIKLFCSKS